VSLPHYPWQRERHWFVSQAERDDGLASPAGGGSAHPLLGRRLRVVRPLWEAALDDGRLTWLDDHRLHGATVFPGAAYAEIGLALSGERHGEPRRGIRDLQFHKALFLPARDQVLLQTTLDADRDRFEIHGAIRGDAPQWTLHASGAVAAAPPAAAPTVDLDAVRARCTREIAHDACYESFAARGLEYGPAFRGIARLWQGEGEALAEVTLPEGVPGAGDGLLHPALLDAAFQVLVVAVTSGREGITDARRTFLPIRIAALDVYAPPGATVWVRTRLVERDDHEVAGDVDILDANGHVLVETRGLRCRLLEAAGAAAESLDDWLYEYRWEPSAWPGSDVVPERSLLTPDWMDRLEPVRRDIPELSRTLGWGGYYAEVEPRLNAIAAQFAVRAFRDLGWALAAGDRRSLAALAASLRIAPAQHLLLGALVKMLVADGVLRESGDAFDVIRSPRDVAPEELAAQLVAERPLYATDVALLTRCGRQLAQVLTGALDAREILFSDEALELLTTFYRDAPPSRFYNTLVGRAVGAVAADRRNGRPLRVLELGAGTGGTTAYVLDQLSGAVEYHFTDVSPLFTERAKVRFAASPAVQVRTLDIERESESQGFSPHSFDMVVAANVLHATADLAHTLERVKTLLSPGGLVVLLEITRRPPWLDVIFGLTDGWWKFADRARRADHPLLDAAQWRTLFGETGFARVETVADAGQGDQSGQSVLLAQLGEVEAAPQPARARRPWLLCSDGGGVADRLAAELGRAVRECMLVPGGALPSNLGERAAGGFEGIVYLAGLDAPSGEDVPAQVLVDGQAAACAGVVDLLRVLDAAGVKSGSLRIVTAGAQQTEDASVPLSIAQSALWGLGRVIMKERPDLHCRMIDLGPAVDAEDVRTLARELCSGDDEEEVSLRAGRRYVRRLRRLEAAAGTTGAVERVAGPDDAFRAEIDVPGALETIVLREATRREPRPDEVEVRIEASGVNFRDVMLGMGMLPALASEGTFGSGQLGLDCAGTVVACGSEVHDVAPGAEVLGIAPGTFGSHATTRGALLARKPEGLEWAQAAAIPCAFVTAYYALVYLARIRAGERVLIHAATGGVGLAALQIAHEAGAEVFATAGSPAKREYLVGLGVRHVYDSRSLEFAEQILRDTDARGVDIVLNSLAGDAIAKGISTLAPFGRFVEIGKRDIYQDSRIGLLPFRANLSFFAVDLDRLCSERPALAGELLRTVVGKFADGSYQPLPQRVFPLSETGEAVRFMARAKHIGKVVVVRTAEDVNIRASKAGAPLARKDGSYLITGGLGGFGLAVAGALAREGAGTLVLMGRSAPGVEADRLVEELRAGGTRVEVMLGDVADESDLARVLGRIRAELPPLRGVVHAAMVLDDAPLAQLDAPRFRTALAPKVGGAWNLHRQTAGDALDFFVLFSSIAALLGNPLQANYAAANAVLDALAHHRRALGRPALAVDWGVLANVGYVSHHPDIADYLERQGYLSFTSAQALDALGALMRRDCTHVMAARIDWARWATSSPAAAASPRLLHFAPSAAQRSGPAAGDRGSVVSLLRAAAAAERDGILESYLRAKVGKVLGMAPAKLEAERPLTEMGFDSLIAVELMTALKMDLGVELPVVKLLQGASLASLGRLVLEHLALPDAPANGRATAVPEPPRPEPVAEPLCADTPAPAAAGAPIPVAAVVPEPRIARVVAAAAGPPPVPPNGAAPARARVDYGALDYTRWSRRQRLVRGAITTGFRLVADVRVEGREHFPDHGPFIIATNHLSMADVPAVLTVLSRPTILMAADWLRSSRLLDWFLGDVGNAIYVRRGEGDREALELGLTVLRSGGVLGLAPEGTRSRNGALGAGHSGIAHLATRAGVPVVPVVAWGQEKLGSQLRRLRRSPVCIRVGPPISFPPGEVTAAELLAYTSQVMQAIATLLPPEYRGVYAVDAPEEPEPVPIS
jgi:1-acyl-sn-glycerol-3-phosphate acyltransferase